MYLGAGPQAGDFWAEGIDWLQCSLHSVHAEHVYLTAAAAVLCQRHADMICPSYNCLAHTQYGKVFAVDKILWHNTRLAVLLLYIAVATAERCASTVERPDWSIGSLEMSLNTSTYDRESLLE